MRRALRVDKLRLAALEQTLRAGRMAVMPGWSGPLGDDGVDQLTDYLLAVSGGQESEAHPGKGLYAQFCIACHGADGIATIPGYPNLAGQNEQYLVSSMNAYKNKERNGGNAAIMQAQAMNLTDDEIAELAKHYAAMK